MEIEVQWEVNIKSGLTQIEISDLGCKSKKEWDALDRDEQKRKINNYLKDSDATMLKVIAREWYEQ